MTTPQEVMDAGLARLRAENEKQKGLVDTFSQLCSNSEDFVHELLGKVDKLRAELEREEGVREDAQKQLAAKTSECDRFRKDAARYKHLKIGHPTDALHEMVAHLYKVKTALEVLTSPWPEWDERIDADITQKKEG